MEDLPGTLGEAISTEPTWLVSWLVLLVGTQFLSIALVIYKDEQGFRFRWEPLAIIGCFLLAGAIMEAMYARMGYVRFLGLAHIIGWAPIYIYLVIKRKGIGFVTLWGKYVHLYLLIAGISLVIDTVDVVRYLVGDDASLYLRWGD